MVFRVVFGHSVFLGLCRFFRGRTRDVAGRMISIQRRTALEEMSGHAFCASAKHAGNVTDGVPVADEGFSCL